MNGLIAFPDKVLLRGGGAAYASNHATLLLPPLRTLLAEKFQAHLAGSWATNEAHLPVAKGNRIFSLSDVDVLANAPIAPNRSAQITNSVKSLARQYGVEISKVSVRSRSEIAAFWKMSRVGSFEGSRFEAGRYLRFWTLVGAVEAVSPIAIPTRDERAYAVTKFFFKLCRNVLLIQGRNSASYRELTKSVMDHLIHDPEVTRAYAIKVGQERGMSTATCDALLSDSYWGPLTDALTDATSSKLLTNLRGDIRTWYRTGTVAYAESYLAQIQTFQGSPEMAPARIKVIHDYETRKTSRNAQRLCISASD